MLYTKIQQVVGNIDIHTLSDARKKKLQPLIDYVQGKVNNAQKIRLNFICTHNSRRSHLAQIWSQTMAAKYGFNIHSYSGGTEATALFPQVKTTLEQQGFSVQQLSQESNPVYAIKYAKNAIPIIGFSKTYDNAFNPNSDFAAILTCSQADEGCPFIAGAEKRIPITYEDPKAFDNTTQQAEKYMERSMQIATEMQFVFSQIKNIH